MMKTIKLTRSEAETVEAFSDDYDLQEKVSTALDECDGMITIKVTTAQAEHIELLNNPHML